MGLIRLVIFAALALLPGHVPGAAASVAAGLAPPGADSGPVAPGYLPVRNGEGKSGQGGGHSGPGGGDDDDDDDEDDHSGHGGGGDDDDGDDDDDHSGHGGGDDDDGDGDDGGDDDASAGGGAQQGGGPGASSSPSSAPGEQIARIVLGRNSVTIYYRNGWRESLVGGIYELRDGRNRRVIRREAGPADHARFAQLVAAAGGV